MSDESRAALSFGMQTAQADPGASSFWQAAYALDIHRRAPTPDESELPEALSAVVSQRASSLDQQFHSLFDRPNASVAHGTMGAIGPGVDGWPSDDSDTPVPPGGDKTVDDLLNAIPAITIHDWLGIPRAGKCCIEKFEYPNEWTRDKRFKNNKYRIGLKFEALMEYSDEPICKCECCLFIQYVLAKWDFWADGKHEEGSTPGGQYVQDCVKKEPEGKAKKKADKKAERDRRMGREASGKGRDHTGISGPPRGHPDQYDCMGEPDRDTPHESWEKAKSTPGDAFEEFGTHAAAGGCKITMRDTPGVWVDPGTEFKWRVSFLGRIYDTCKLKLKLTKRFDADWSGNTVDGVHFDKTPGLTYFPPR